MVQLELLHLDADISTAASNLRSINKYYLHIYHYGADMECHEVVVYIILMRTLVWNLIFIAKAQYSSVDQLSPVCCGADIATDSNEAFELFRR